jgi:hypothetical protein
VLRGRLPAARPFGIRNRDVLYARRWALVVQSIPGVMAVLRWGVSRQCSYKLHCDEAPQALAIRRLLVIRIDQWWTQPDPHPAKRRTS